VGTHETRFGELMKAAQAGDQDAYEELLAQIAPLVRRVIRRQRAFFSTDEVEDVVQDVLLSLHAVRATYDPARPFTPWLLAITRNRLVDHARRHARVDAREVVLDDLDVTFFADATNQSKRDYGDPEELHRAIAALPAGQRQAIELLKLQGLSLKEAAYTSGTTVGALKVASHRAMAALKRMLNK
jgi:RNA polymerase sigma-70 factor (ECF subfamily)